MKYLSNKVAGMFKTEPYIPYGKRKYLNKKVLIISDPHTPYHHKDLIKFLKAVKDKYKPDRIICIGDELDYHAQSFHDSDPDLMSPGDELKKAVETIQEMHQLFPKVDLLESNHGSMVHRKAKCHGIPRACIRSYQEVLGVSNDWKWHEDLTITLPNRKQVYMHHGKSANVFKLSQAESMSCVQGHYHEKFNIHYWSNSNALYWGMQVGCLIDDKSYAYAYNNTNLKRPLIGLGMIIDSQPKLIPLIKGKNGRWNGKLT